MTAGTPVRYNEMIDETRISGTCIRVLRMSSQATSSTPKKLLKGDMRLLFCYSLAESWQDVLHINLRRRRKFPRKFMLLASATQAT